MTLTVALSALLSHWRRRPAQLALLILGLSLATALWSGVQAINAEARASYDRAAALLGQDRLAQLARRDGGAIAQTDFVALSRAGWLVSPVLEGTLRLEGSRLRLLGIEPLSLPAQAETLDLGRGGGDLLPFITPPGLLYAAPETVKALAAVPGLPPLRASPNLLPGTALTDIGTAQRLLGRPGEISRLLVLPEQPMGRANLENVAPDLALKAPEAGGDLSRLTDSFHLNLTAFGFLAFAVGLFIVYSAIGLAFEQRRVTFRTLRALGLSARALTAALLLELIVFALAAGLIGVALGYLVGAALLPGVSATLEGLYGASVPGTLSLRPQWWVSGLAIALIGTLAAAMQSLWRVWHLPLLAPGSPRAWARASEHALIGQAAAGLGLLILSIGLGLWGSGLIAGFTVLGALLFGAALLLPVLLALVLAGLQRLVRRPVAEWFLADSRQQLPGLSLALMALLLALSANIGVGTMVSSFRLTFTGWLDQRLASELYVTARNPAEAERLTTFLQGKVDAILPIWHIEGSLEGAPGAVYGAADHATYRDHWPLLAALPDSWDRVATGRAAMINEQLARRARLKPGGSLTLPGGWQVEIAGIYSDYGNPEGQAIVNSGALVAHYPTVERLRFGLRLAPGGVPALMAEIADQLKLPADNMVDQATIKRRSLDVFEQTFTVTAALNVLTLGVAGLAMVASLTTLSAMRLPQLAPVWAMGLTRRRLVRLELARTLMLAALTFLAALPVGLALAYVLLAIINVEAFGWRLPMHIFPADWLRLGLLALLAALLSALIPLRRLARLAPADLLKVFAHER
ncbi:ABC transporter permease [Xaviernesmea oryzae]|uniref:ABC transporter permease n=1 Tax=Xaviernesmea oryzae TaxID=464029 RepID=A0A1Q9AQN4_9HYPH|nr:ABC transporter permease [Xaviernesmea oryzae]OLP57724.1 ABC transporter permease [Xaviernesmea oryzae]SEM05735.1 putative ABC transport system permease protein [Xaviernesmea oryzae]